MNSSLSSDELIAGLQNATLELAIMVRPTGEQTAGIEFELLRTYPWCVALSVAHPFARLKSIALEKIAAQPLVALRRKDYSEYHRILERIFAPLSAKPRIAVECDSASSLVMEVEAGRGIACGDHDPQTRGWQTPALPPTHWHDGSTVRWHRPRHKG
jgi:DNA-binding transcriptional LysR family regulator